MFLKTDWFQVWEGKKNIGFNIYLLRLECLKFQLYYTHTPKRSKCLYFTAF